MSDFIKQLFYTITVLLIGNSFIVLLLLGNLLSTKVNGIFTIVISLLLVYIYHFKVWLPLREKFYELDNKCCKLMGW